MTNPVLPVIYAAIDEINATHPPSGPLVKSPDTILAGPGAALGSLALVDLIVAMEMGLEQAYGIEINLTEGQAFTQDENPFRTVATVAEHIAEVLKKKGSAP